MLIVAATTNHGKIREIKSYFSEDSDVFVIPMSILRNVPDFQESGKTFAENAVIKATEASRIFASHIIADDSGLVVDALNGAPGIYSARFMGLNNDADKNRVLLEKLAGIPKAERTARFVCAVAHADPEGKITVFEESCEGLITELPSGSSGFGYDPVFFIPQLNKTMAEITTAEKNRLSHRAGALKKFRDYFMSNYGQKES